MTTPLSSFIDVSPQSDFPIQNLPYGSFSTTVHGKRRVGVALGDWVMVSGTDIILPSGQIKLPDQERPVFSACHKLDFELETGFIIGKSSQVGQPIPIESAWDHIFGMVLFNDWSARDLPMGVCPVRTI